MMTRATWASPCTGYGSDRCSHSERCGSICRVLQQPSSAPVVSALRRTAAAFDAARVREIGPPLAIGVVAALMIVGPAGMDPTNIGWSGKGDSATHILGWWFFRNSPWSFPLGANPAYGLEFGSSIFYSDSIPLLAFAFKALSPWLPSAFQYLGLWAAFSIVLQAWFAWKLLGCLESTRAGWIRLFAAGLFTFSPPLMIRVGGHTALSSHWLLVAGLYLYVKADDRSHRVAWPVLAFACSLIHSYLFVMLLALWFAACLRRWLARAAGPRVLLVDALLVLCPALVGLWQAGFFMVQVKSAGGYGRFGANLLALANPGIYSYVMAPVAPPAGFHEGYNFLGLGCLLLVPMVLPALLSRRPSFLLVRRHWPLLLVLACLSAFALTNRISVSSLTLPAIPLPDAVLELANVLRSSGRMLWPTFYVVVLVLVVSLARRYEPRVASTLLAIALVVQVADTSQGWLKHRRAFAAKRASIWPTPFQSEFWQAAATEYRRLRTVPLQHHPDDYAVRAYYAASHGMATDSAYLARVDPRLLDAARARSEEAIRTGDFEPDTLYLLDNAHAVSVSQRIHTDSDLLALIDGFYVLAPGWKQRAVGTTFSEPLSPLSLGEAPALPRELFFGAKGNGVAYLGQGWSDPESWGVWSDEAHAELRLALDGGDVPLQIAVEVSALLADAQPTRDAECWINGSHAGTLRFDSRTNSGWRSITISPEIAAVAGDSRLLDIEFRMQPEPSSPRRLGLGQDTRPLGIALRRLKLSSKPGP